MEAQPTQVFGSPASSQGFLAPNNSPSHGFPTGERVQPHVLSRALEANIPASNDQMNTSCLVRPQQFTTHLRRSAGVPSLRSTRPGNHSQSQLDEMNNAFFPVQSYDHSQENMFNHQHVWSQQPGYGQRHDYDQQRGYNQQGGSGHHVSYVPQSNYNPESAVVSSLPLPTELKSNPKTGRRACPSAAAALFIGTSYFRPDRIIIACSGSVDHRAARLKPATYRPPEELSQ